MNTNTHPVRALIGEMTEYLDQQVDPELDVIAKWRDRLEAAQPAAPSGEAVGDWVLVPRTPTDAMLRAAQSAWLNDPQRRTTTMWSAMLYTAPQQPAAVDEVSAWSKQQPACPGIYGIRGFNLCRPASEQFEAVVVVREYGGELVCNLHESTSEDDLESWAPICDLDPDFEWRAFVPGWEQRGGRAIAALAQEDRNG